MESQSQKKMGIWIETGDEGHRLGVTTDAPVSMTPENFHAKIEELGASLGELLANMGVLPSAPGNPENE